MSSAILALITALIPEVPKLAADLKAVFTKHPNLTPDQVLAAVQAIATSTDAQVQSDLAQIAADQAPKQAA